MSDLNNLLEIAEDDKQSSYRRRQAITDLLKKHPSEDQTFGIINKLLSGNDTALQRDVVGAVKDAPDPKILPAIKHLLVADDDYLRRDAIQVIGRIGSKEEVALIQELTSDKSFSVSYAAKSALSEIERRISEETIKEEAKAEEESLESVEDIEQEEDLGDPEELKVEEEAEAKEESLEPVEDVQDLEDKEELEVQQEPKSEEEDIEVEESLEEDPEEKSNSEEEVSKTETTEPVEDVEEIKAHQQKLPESLHDNSIYGESSIEDVNKKVEDEIESEISEKAPILTTPLNIDNSSNLKQFFDKETHLALAMYKQLATYSDELPAKEAAVSEAKRQLTLLEADKADDVDKSQETVKSEQGDVDEINWQIKKAKKDLEDYEKDNESLLNSLMFMFSADKKDEVVAQKAKLKEKIRNLKEQLSKEEDELVFAKNEKSSLLEPIIEMRKKVEEKNKDRDAVIAKVVGAEKDINELITRLLLSSDPEKLKSRLSFLATSHSAMARLACEKIVALVSKVRREEMNTETLTTEYEELVKKSTDNMVSLGQEITKSLVSKETSVKKEVKVNVNVGFKEEESFFSFSNASGTANGTGTASGTMKVEELSWRQSPNLENSVNSYSNSFSELGNKAAQKELGEIAFKSSEAVLNSYIDYLRTLIEADFGA